MTDTLPRLTAALADRYTIERELGSGGMATVYLAEDLKHHRKVAVKVLRPELAAVLGAERFLKEIEVTANLQHPHILPLFDSGEADAFLYYVMPHVEGESLRDRLNREKQLPVEEAVRIAEMVATALDYAHRHDIVHRDIKPDNILLHDEQALVADFGIALAVSAAAGARMTETGLSLGTPHYMSPEQATADREITGASDVYSLACVTYEMLTGDPPYLGNTAQAIIAKIMTDVPRPVRELRATVPPHVELALRKALEKIPADRFTTAKQFAEALANPAFTLPTPSAHGMPEAEGVVPPAPWKRYVWPAAATVLLGLLVWKWVEPPPPATVARYGLALAPDQELLDVFDPTFVLAPDASRIVYVGPGSDDDQLWVKQRDEYLATPLPGTDGARGPVVSPDGQWIAFIASGELRKVPAGGGIAVTVADSVQVGIRSPAWLDDGTLVYTDVSWRLRRVPEVGGRSEVIFTPDPPLGAYSPVGLPGGRGVLFAVCRPGAQCRGHQEAWVVDLRSGEARMLMSDVARSWYVQTGHLVYVRPGGEVFAVPFDLGSLVVRGTPVQVLEGVQVGTGISPDFALSETGVLLMLSGGGQGRRLTVVSVDRDGNAAPIDPDWSFLSPTFVGMDLSPDGTRLAINIHGGTGADIWIKQLDRGPLSRLTFSEADDARPRWTPDGNEVTFVSDRGGTSALYAKRADGTGPTETLVEREHDVWEGAWSPDGTWLVIRSRAAVGRVGSRDILGIRPGVDSVPVPLVVSGFDEKAAALSPDGKWLAYQSDETGVPEVYVRPFPDTGAGKWQVSTAGGEGPAWAHSGRELFYVERGGGRKMMVAAIDTGPPFTVGERRALFPLGTGYALSLDYTAYNVTPDDQHFLILRVTATGDQSMTGRLIIVENWFEELRQRVGN